LLKEYLQRWERRVLHLPVFVRAEGNQSVTGRGRTCRAGKYAIAS
jgi:hypothetical protein